MDKIQLGMIDIYRNHEKSLDEISKPEWVRYLEDKEIGVRPNCYNPDNIIRKVLDSKI